MGAFLQTLKNLGALRLSAIGVVTMVVLAFLVFLISRVTAPNLSLLYRDLNPQDAGQIVAQLEAAQIPYQLRQGGTEILVPDNQVNRLRLTMAEQGLPTGGSVGYEIFNKGESLGTTAFQQNVNLVRALEGELARTIASLQAVQSARVHLVLPRRQLFSREEQLPSASIALKLVGARLKPEQVLAIQQLVAAAVPQLEPSRISVIDERGSLLARGFGEGAGGEFLTSTVEELKVKQETRLRQTIEDLLSRSLGFGRVRAEVSVEMDFDRLTRSEERFNPEEQVVRSTQTVEESSTSSETDGIDPVTLEGNLPDADLGGAGGTALRSEESRTEETVNFEISKTTTRQIKEVGTVKRLTVAVLVDGSYDTDENGELIYSERSADDLEKIATLVRSAVGYDAGRGDQVEVINMRFVDVGDIFPEADADKFFGLERQDLLELAKIVAFTIAGILVMLLIIRPLLTRLFETLPASGESIERRLLVEPTEAQPALAGPAPVPAPAPHMVDEAGEELINISQVEGRVKASSVKKIGEIVEKHPEEALSIIRNWLYQEG